MSIRWRARAAMADYGAAVARALAGLDRGYLVVLAICLVALWPFLSRPALPQATDAELHIFRLAELSRVVRGGELYPRWAPNFYYGFGYPIFNYYAPLIYYLGLLIDFLPGLGPVEAIKALFVAGIIMAAAGMYAYARELWGRRAAFVAAGLYVYAPYVLYVDPHARGDAAESFTFGLFALALAAMDRLRRRPRAATWLVATILIAGLILTHNLMGLVFFGLLAGWTAWQRLGRWRGGSAEAAPAGRVVRFRLELALLLGVGLTAFFWLVVALERDAVNLTTLIGPGGHFDFRNHFVPASELFGPGQLLDWGATEPPFSLNIGLVQLAMTAAGVAALLLGRVANRSHVGFAAVAFVTMLFMLRPASTVVWDAVPLLPYLQFPWRLLGPLAAMAAILGAAGAAWLATTLPGAASGWVSPALVATTLLLALPLTLVPPWPADFGPTTAERVLAEELEGRWLGTTSTADFVPVTVEVQPRPQPALVAEYEADGPVTRLNRATLPDGARAAAEIITPLHFRYQVTSPVPFALRLFLHDFPGWGATIDGRPVAKELGRPEGFVVVPVPAGTHQVDVSFDATPARRLATLISLVSVAAAAVIAGRFHRNGATPGSHAPPVSIRPLGSAARATILVALTFFFVRAALLERSGVVHLQSNGLQALPAGVSTYANFNDQIALIGYDAPERAVRPGQRIELTAYWKALKPAEINYQVFAHVLDERGTLVAQSDKLNPGGFPTRLWPLDKYVRDAHTIVLPADLPPGSYKLSVGLWVAAEGWRLPLRDSSGLPGADHFILERALEVR